MSATASQISTYLTNIYSALADYTDKVILKEMLGEPTIFSNRVTASVLIAYVDIITEYFSQAVYAGGYFLTDYNFFDSVEAEDIMFRINRICDTNYHLDLD